MSLPCIQKRLDELDPGETLSMERGDYGPCVIRKPVTLHCDYSTFWTDGDVPALTIQSAGVVVKDANIRTLETATRVVLAADKDNHPLFQNVRIYGRAIGIESEPCEWILPPRVDTGVITAHHPGFFIDLAVPHRTRIVCRISGVSMDPSVLNLGVNTVKLHITDAMPDSIMIGEIEVIGSTLTRLIPFFARITTNCSAEAPDSPPPLYEIPSHDKERFQKCLAGNPSTPIHLPTDSKSSRSAKPNRTKALAIQSAHPRPIPDRISEPVDVPQPKPKKFRLAKSIQVDQMKLGGAFAKGDIAQSSCCSPTSKKEAPDEDIKSKLSGLFVEAVEQISTNVDVNHSMDHEALQKEPTNPKIKGMAHLSKLFSEPSD
jgi:hypothetical protein